MNLSKFEKHAFSVALLLGLDVEPSRWYYIGQRAGKYQFRHKLSGAVRSV